MNGEELPGLLDTLAEWVRQNRDPNTGLVFGATVREPTEEQTVKTYGFLCDDEYKPFYVFVWQFGNVNIGTADFTRSRDAPESEVFFNEEFEFEETSQVMAKVDSFLRESAFLTSNASVAEPDAP